MNSKKAPPIDDREWEIQERGMRAAHSRRAEATDPAVECYRRVATALLHAPRSEPPADFASAVVAQVAVRDTGIERALFRSLFVVLAAVSVIVTALYGDQWWRAVQGVPVEGALQWLVAGTGCVALSWMGGQLHQMLAMRAAETSP